MAVSNNISQSAYGVGQPLIGVPKEPIVSDRNPTVNDKATLGQMWITPSTNTAYVLVAITNNQAIWGIYPTPIVGNFVVGGTITAGLGLTVTAGGATIGGNSSVTGDLTVNGNIINPAGSLTMGGDIYANSFSSTNDPTYGAMLYQNALWGIGTDPDVDVAIVMKGDGAFAIDGLWGGVLLSQWRTRQASAQTVDATQTVLFSLPLLVEEMITIKAVVNGFKSTYDHALSGDILISAFRPAAGNVTQIGAKVVSGYIDDTATAGVSVDAAVDVPTQTIRILVTGAVAETWNWVTTAMYMYTSHP